MQQPRQVRGVRKIVIVAVVGAGVITGLAATLGASEREPVPHSERVPFVEGKGVPVLDQHGTVVGYADYEELFPNLRDPEVRARVEEQSRRGEIQRVPVYDDSGKLVGHFGNVFEPLGASRRDSVVTTTEQLDSDG